jgi:hypothetical protein
VLALLVDISTVEYVQALREGSGNLTVICLKSKLYLNTQMQVYIWNVSLFFSTFTCVCRLVLCNLRKWLIILNC